MTRDELATWVGARYGAYLESVDRLAVDEPGDLEEPISDAYELLGYLPADIATAAPVEPSPIADARVMAAYTTMVQVVRDLGTSFDLSSEGDNYRLSQMLAAAERELQRTAAAVLERGLSLTLVGDAPGIGAWNLNFLPT